MKEREEKERGWSGGVKGERPALGRKPFLFARVSLRPAAAPSISLRAVGFYFQNFRKQV